MIKNTHTALCLLLLHGSLLCSSAYGLTFADYFHRLQCHPKLGAIFAEIEKYNQLSYGEMGLPDPQVMIGVDNIPIESPAFDRFLPSSKTFGVQQQIPSYGLRKAKSLRHRNVANKHELMAEYTMQRLEAYLISALVRLEEINEENVLLGSKLQNYVLLERHLRGKLEAGDPVYGRLSEVDIERIEVEKRLNELKMERASIEAELVRLVEEVPKVKIPNIPHYRDLPGSDRVYPVLVAMQEVCIAQDGISIANHAYAPNYGIKALYKQRETGRNFSGDDWFSVQATVSFPIWSHWNQGPKLQAAKAEMKAAEYSRENLIREWKKKLTVISSERDTSLENLNLLTEKEQAISELVASAERDYEAGNSDLPSVLNARIDGLTVAIQKAKLKGRYARLSAEFNSHIVRRDTR